MIKRAILLLALGACSFSGPIRVDKVASKFKFPEPLPGWSRKNPDEGAQRLYENIATGAVLSVSSTCERYEISPLKTLARAALEPLGTFTEKENRTFSLAEREALEILAAGKVDGVPVEVDYVVLRKDNCIFDFSLQVSPTVTAGLRKDFLTMVGGFDY